MVERVGIWAKLKERVTSAAVARAAELVRSVEAATDERGLDDLPSSIGWLLDAPLFIDEKQVEAFYDAVLAQISKAHL